MKCPNCHCEISSNERICRYCGYDIDASRMNTMMHNQEAMYYRNQMQYYEDIYRQERERNERYRQLTVVVLIAAVLLLNLIEILLVLWL